jgi:hypothetical protein
MKWEGIYVWRIRLDGKEVFITHVTLCLQRQLYGMTEENNENIQHNNHHAERAGIAHSA